MSVKDAKTNFIRVGQYNATVGVAKAKRNKTEKRFTDDQMKRKFPLKRQVPSLSPPCQRLNGFMVRYAGLLLRPRKTAYKKVES